MIDLDLCSVDVSNDVLPEFFLDCVDGNKEYSDLVIRCHLTAAAVEGELVVAEVPDKGIVGAAVWFGPGPKCLFR